MLNLGANLLRSTLGRNASLVPRVAELRAFSWFPVVLGKQMPPRPKPPPEDEIEESFLKGSGPGGQKIVRP